MCTSGGDASTQAVLVGGNKPSGGKGAEAVVAVPVMTGELAELVLGVVDLASLQDRLMHIMWSATQSAMKEDGAYGMVLVRCTVKMECTVLAFYQECCAVGLVGTVWALRSPSFLASAGSRLRVSRA